MNINEEIKKLSESSDISESVIKDFLITVSKKLDTSASYDEVVNAMQSHCQQVIDMSVTVMEAKADYDDEMRLNCHIGDTNVSDNAKRWLDFNHLIISTLKA